MKHPVVFGESMSDGHSKEKKKEATELKAKQILSEFEGRLTLVERMTARLRPLRPPVCTSRRLFDYFEIPDPYHPLDYNKPYKPEVGPSKLILGENRRPVAPHAKVPELKPRIETSKPKAPQAFRPQGIPSAATREPSRTAPAPRPQPKAVQPKPNQKPEFGQKKGHAVAKLPVRPDISTVKGGNQPTAATNQSGTSQAPINRSIPKPMASTQKSRSGNFRMRRSTISNSQPVVKQVNPAPTPPPAPVASPKSDVQPVNRSPNAASGSGGLDDLFGFGNPEGRMKIPRSTKTQSPPNVRSVPRSNPNVPTVPKSEAEATPSAKPKKTVAPAKPINRSPNAASGSGGLDDLFGFGNPEGRMKIPRSTPTGAAKKNHAIFDKNPIQKPDDGKPPSKK